MFLNAVAAWLWTGRKGIIAGRAAAALHGAKWVNASTPIEVIAQHGRRRSGVIVYEQRIGNDEIMYVANMPRYYCVAHCARPGPTPTAR